MCVWCDVCCTVLVTTADVVFVVEVVVVGISAAMIVIMCDDVVYENCNNAAVTVRYADDVRVCCLHCCC